MNIGHIVIDTYKRFSIILRARGIIKLCYFSKLNTSLVVSGGDNVDIRICTHGLPNESQDLIRGATSMFLLKF